MNRPDGPRPPRDPDRPELFVDRITRDGSGGWPVEPGRYRLIVAHACPWAHRAVVVRRLLGLEAALPLGTAGPLHDERSWRFDLDPGGRDPVLGIRHLREAYERADPGYDDGVIVPSVVDVPSGRLVTNDHRTLTVDLCTEWRDHHRRGAPDLYPAALAPRIHALHPELDELAIAPYRAGFAPDQAAYDAAHDDLFDRLDAFEERLRTSRYLLGDTVTEPDVRLWTILLRLDLVYAVHFKCNRRALAEMPALWGYARDLFATPGFGDTVGPEAVALIKQHYFAQHTEVNPRGIVPGGPSTARWYAPHDRGVSTRLA